MMRGNRGREESGEERGRDRERDIYIYIYIYIYNIYIIYKLLKIIS